MSRSASYVLTGGCPPYSHAYKQMHLGRWDMNMVPSPQNPLPSIQQIPSVKRLEREADDSPSGSPKVKNRRSYASNPPMCLHGVHRDSRTLLTFTFI